MIQAKENRCPSCGASEEEFLSGICCKESQSFAEEAYGEDESVLL